MSTKLCKIGTTASFRLTHSHFRRFYNLVQRFSLRRAAAKTFWSGSNFYANVQLNLRPQMVNCQFNSLEFTLPIEKKSLFSEELMFYKFWNCKISSKFNKMMKNDTK